MTVHRPLNTVILNLHESPKKTVEIFRRLILDPKKIEGRTDDSHWGTHTHCTDLGLQSLFPKGGLKRAKATNIVDQLTDAGFRYEDCQLVVGKKPSKMYTQFLFTRQASGPLAPTAILLGSVLQNFVWRRVRGTLAIVDQERVAMLELCNLMQNPQGPITEVQFDLARGFEIKHA